MFYCNIQDKTESNAGQIERTTHGRHTVMSCPPLHRQNLQNIRQLLFISKHSRLAFAFRNVSKYSNSRESRIVLYR